MEKCATFQSGESLNGRITALVVITLALLLPTMASAGLVVHYQFEGTDPNTVTDLAGGDDDGTILSPAARDNSSVPPINGGVQSFRPNPGPAGSNGSIVNMTNSLDVVAGKSGNSFAAWVNTDSLPEGENFLFHFNKSNDSSVRFGGLVTGAGTLNLLSKREDASPGSTEPFSSAGVITTSAGWQHVAFVVDYANADYQMYVDGNDVGNGAATWGTGMSGAASVQARLGGFDGDRSYHGLLDDVRIYDHALTLQEIGDLIGGIVTPVEFTWNLNGLGNWNSTASWMPSSGPPNNVGHTAILGSSITSNSTITVDTPVTVNRIQFDNTTHTYAVGGLASVNLAATTDPSSPVNPTLSVQGNHQFQAVVNLLADATADVSSGSTLTFNNTLDLMGHTLTKTGSGTVAIRNDLTLGGGTVNIQQGTVAGNGTIGGDVINDGGTISPGNLTSGDLSVVPEPGSLLLLALGWLVTMIAGSRFAGGRPADRHHGRGKPADGADYYRPPRPQ